MVYHVLALEVLDDQLHDVLQQDSEMVGQMRMRRRGEPSPRRGCARGEPAQMWPG